jgi:putative (di)nucleoside polyphosphate hydrolase
MIENSTSPLYRTGVGVMLLNREGRILLCRRNDIEGGAWQMPQGGIANGEDPRIGAFRELKEEIGTDSAIILAESADWLSYDIPVSVRPRVWGGKYVGQRQKWFLMRFMGRDEDINLDTDNPEQHPEFDGWIWVPARDLPDLVVSFKRPLYEALLHEFAELCRPMEDPAQAT